MNIDKPVPETTPGPDYAGMLNDALDKIDAHDHTTGYGKKINQAGIQFNGDFDANEQTIKGLKSAVFSNQATPISLSYGLYVYNYNLFFKTPSGTVQLTEGNFQFSSGELKYKTVTTNSYAVSASDRNYVIGYNLALNVKTVTLPAAASVGAFYIVFRDIAGDAGSYPISFQPFGTERINNVAGPTMTPLINTNGGVARLICDGVSKWWTI